MESLFQSGVVVEASSAFSTAYILSKNEDFLTTEYKVLKTKASAGLIKCSRLMYNGNVKLVYFTNGLKPLNTLWNSMDEESCIRILTNLFHTVIELRNNGFLNCHNLVISEDKVYVDMNTFAVHLIYLPVSNDNWDVASFESDLRARMLKELSANNKLITGRMNELGSMLSNGILSMEEVHRHMSSMCKASVSKSIMPEEPVITQKYNDTYQNESRENRVTNTSAIQLVSLDIENPVTLVIDKPEYTIGKNPSLVDGAITFNKAISRIHCKITIQNDVIYISDLGSANGTYVNQIKLAREERTRIRQNDVIRLANSDFIIKMGGV